jgi:uncharacterized Tic20 family protein
MTEDQVIQENTQEEQIATDHTAAFAEAFFIGNLLFVGAFYIALWILFLLRYKEASSITQHHLKQTLIASSISTSIFIAINIFIMLTSGYASVTALFLLEFYFMILLPLFLVAGILGFTKAVKGIDFNYPLIGRFS